jgi:pre-mRNA-splicing factor SYF1
MAALNDILTDDIPYEQDILQNQYNVKVWLRYLEHKKKTTPEIRFRIYERAVKQLPGSYKLWYRYLCERRKATKGLSPIDPAREVVNYAFERALASMHKMPRIWIDYLKYLTRQRLITKTRRAFDQALLSLPVTQHDRIWPLYIAFIKSHNIPETTVRVYRRYLRVDPGAAEDYIEYLVSIGRLDDAAVKLADAVNDDRYVSKKGRTQHELWQWLCELISQNPGEIESLRVDPIIRGGLRRFTDMLGKLWCALADYYTRQGNFEKARDIYEEAIETVMTVRDFSQVFEAYAEFEEAGLTRTLEEIDENDEDSKTDAEMRMARYEGLMERRPLLLSSVLLRQNPHNVEEWHKRVALFESDPMQMVKTYTEAVQTVDPGQALGKPHTLWSGFAKMYEARDSLNEARQIFDKATKSDFTKVEDLIAIWTEYAEMEIRNKNYKQARLLMQQATATPPGLGTSVGFHDSNLTAAQRVHKSLKLWALYADLEAALGTFESTRAVYSRILELRIANPQLVLNFAGYLEENRYFEDAFTAYERGISMFKWPAVFEIWDVYLVKFIQRYKGTKIERTRELFEQCLTKMDDKFAKQVYFLYATFEEQHGLARHAMKIYERATLAVPKNERFDVWKKCIDRTSATFGVTFTRDLYSQAIEALPDKEARVMCIEFADLERKLGEVDRARAVYAHCSQLCDPRTDAKFWKTWNDFELRHGNEDTYREMLRLKRSVAASYNTGVSFLAAANTAAEEARAADDMAALEAEATEMAKAQLTKGFVKSGGEAFEPAATNADEINLDDDSDDSDDDAADDAAAPKASKHDAIDIEVTQTVPDEVFGGIKMPEPEPEAEMGAKARFAAAK